MYYVICLGRSEAKLLAEHTKLAMFWADSRSGSCDRHSAEFRQPRNAVVQQRIDTLADGQTALLVLALDASRTALRLCKLPALVNFADFFFPAHVGWCCQLTIVD